MQLSSCYLFEGLSETQLNSIISIGNETRIQKGQWLFREGEDAQQMFILKAGAVELLTTVENDIELPITIVRKPGNCFGTSTLVPPHTYSLSARGAEDGALLVLKKTDLENLIKADYELILKPFSSPCIIEVNLDPGGIGFAPMK
jgi:CRP/FNR family transcriptional regulator